MPLPARRTCGLRARARHEHQLAALRIHLDRIAIAEPAGQDRLRQRVLQLLLDRALERSRTVDRIEADVSEQLESLVAQFDADAALAQSLLQPAQLDPRDRLDLRLVQRVEDHDVVQPVDELRAEMRLHHAHHRGLHLDVGLR